MLFKAIHGRKTPTPRGYAVCWHRDFKMITVVAPWGLHWVARLARWAYEGVEFRLPLALEPGRGYYVRRLGPWPLMRSIVGDNIAAGAGVGLCWTQAIPHADGGLEQERFTAPIGLNLLYACLRRCLPDNKKQ